MIRKIKKVTNKLKFLNMMRAAYARYIINKKRNVFCFDDSLFYRTNIGCKGKAYYGYINIDEYRTKGRVYVSPMDKLPFLNSTVKYQLVDGNIFLENHKNIEKIINEWKRVIVPNGILAMDNFRVNSFLQEKLLNAGFVEVYRKICEFIPIKHFVYSPSENSFFRKKMYVHRKDRELIISSNFSGDAEEFNFQTFLPNDKYSVIILKQCLEYILPKNMELFFNNLKNLLSEGGKLDIVIPNEKCLEEEKYVSFFDKANFSLLAHETGFSFDKIEFKKGHLYFTLVKKEELISISGFKKEAKTKVCVLGQYMMFRYSQLGYDWDGVARALDECGCDSLLLEGMRNVSYEDLRKAIITYKPKYIITLLKEMLPFLEYIKDDLKNLGICTIFWFTDPDEPWEHDYSRVIDYMFISAGGQIESYKKAFNIKNVFFMAQPASPYIFYRHHIPQIYDIGFTGALSKASLHDTRRKSLTLLSNKYEVAIRNNVRNNVAEFYSQSKIVFGASNFHADLYTSNRIWVAMSCGAAYMTNRFSGIERFVKNRKHVLIFNDEKDLMDITKYYLENDQERESIGINAAKLIRDKHTYTHRIKNIFDIVNGKTTDFYGFL